MEFQQSRTYTNLENAYQSQLMFSTLLRIFADRARLDGYIEISNIFEATSGNEKEHARIWLRNLNNGNLPNTEQNLLTAANESRESGNQYREYSSIAREEGYDDIAALFNGVANIELNHDLQFRSLYNQVLRDEVFCKPDITLWICLQCGNIMSGICAPEICPVCGFPQGYYKEFFQQPL